MQCMLFKNAVNAISLNKSPTWLLFPLQSEPKVLCSSSLKYQTTSLKSVENQTRLRLAAIKPQNVVEKLLQNTECGHNICKSETLRDPRITSRISNYLKYKLYRIWSFWSTMQSQNSLLKPYIDKLFSLKKEM